MTADSRTEGSILVFNSAGATRLRHRPFIDAVISVTGWCRLAFTEIRIIFLDRDTHRRMNREFLGHDYDTDVITFPLEADPVEAEIYINVDQARLQAEQEQVGLYVELRRLAIHGALHLCGFDDATTEEKAEIGRLEDRFLFEEAVAEGGE